MFRTIAMLAAGVTAATAFAALGEANGTRAAAAAPACPLSSGQDFVQRAETLLRDVEAAARARQGETYLRLGNAVLDLVETCRAEAQEEAKQTLSRLVGVARVSVGIGDAANGDNFLKRLVSVTQAVLGPQDPDFATSLSALGLR